MTDKTFVKGLIVKKPHQNAPSFVVAAGSVKVAEFAAFAKEPARDRPLGELDPVQPHETPQRAAGALGDDLDEL